MVILASFGTGEAFAAVGADARLQIWDSVTGRPKHEYVEKKHFQHSYTCIAYGSAAAAAGAKAKRKEGNEAGFVALGTNDGKIVLWDLKRGVVAHILGADANLSAVTDVAFSRDGKYVYASYTDYGSVLQWDAASGQQQAQLPGDKKGVRRLAFNPKTNLIAIASSSLRLMETGDGSASTGRRRKLQTRHSSGISLVKFSRDGRYVVTAGVGTRFVHLFAVESADNDAIATVAFPGVPTHLDVLATSASGGVVVDIVAALEDGGVAVVRQFVGADGTAGVAQTCTITLGNSATNVKALAARFIAGGDALVARGSVGKLSFTRVNYTNETGEILATVDIEAATTQATTAAEEHKQVDADGEQDEVHVIGLKDMGEKKRPKLAGADEDEGDEGAASAKKRSRSGSLDLSTVPLAERLAALSEQLTREEKQEFAAKKKATGPQPPRAESLATVLEQALQAKDDALLEQCLSCTDPAVIDSTAARLSPARALPFLTKLVAKFEKKPSRGSLLTHWLMAVLKKHSAFLVTVPDLSRHLGGVSQLLENRLATYSKLAALGGRLELILAQVHQQKEFSQLRQGPAEPLATYNEEDDDDEDHDDEDHDDEEDDDEDVQEEEDMILNGELGSDDDDDVQEHDDDDEDYQQEEDEDDDDDDDDA